MSLLIQPFYHEVSDYDTVFKHIVQHVQEQDDQMPEDRKKLDDLKWRWSNFHEKVFDHETVIDDVVQSAITCEEALEEIQPHLKDIEEQLNKITCIPIEPKGLAKQQNILKVIHKTMKIMCY